MKFSVALFVLLAVSQLAKASSKLDSFEIMPLQKWSPIYSLGYDSGSYQSFKAFNANRQTLLPSANTNSRKASPNSTARPMAWDGSQYIEMPELATALYKGNVSQEYYAVSNKALYFKSAPGAGWNPINGFPISIANLKYPHFVLDAQNQVLAFVGYDLTTPINSYGKNNLVIWNFKIGESKEILVGTGFEGMSSLVILPEKKLVVTASMGVRDWHLVLKAFDFAGNLVGEYPQINNYFNTGSFYRGYSSRWHWGIDLGLDTKTQELLVQYYSSDSNDSLVDLAKAKIYRVDISKDQVLGEEQP